MILAILFWLAVVIVGYFFVNKWHPTSDPYLRFWHNVILGVLAFGTLGLIVKVIFKFGRAHV